MSKLISKISLMLVICSALSCGWKVDDDGNVTGGLACVLDPIAVVASTALANSSINLGDSSAHINVDQIFKNTSGSAIKIAQVVFQALRSGGITTEELQLEIHNDDAGEPSATILSGGTSNSIDILDIGLTSTTVVLTFSNPPTLADNATYHFILTSDLDDAVVGTFVNFSGYTAAANGLGLLVCGADVTTTCVSGTLEIPSINELQFTLFKCL